MLPFLFTFQNREIILPDPVPSSPKWSLTFQLFSTTFLYAFLLFSCEFRVTSFSSALIL
jgi:hypothetical protein